MEKLHENVFPCWVSIRDFFLFFTLEPSDVSWRFRFLSEQVSPRTEQTNEAGCSRGEKSCVQKAVYFCSTSQSRRAIFLKSLRQIWTINGIKRSRSGAEFGEFSSAVDSCRWVNNLNTLSHLLRKLWMHFAVLSQLTLELTNTFSRDSWRDFSSFFQVFEQIKKRKEEVARTVETKTSMY